MRVVRPLRRQWLVFEFARLLHVLQSNHTLNTTRNVHGLMISVGEDGGDEEATEILEVGLMEFVGIGVGRLLKGGHPM